MADEDDNQVIHNGSQNPESHPTPEDSAESNSGGSRPVGQTADEEPVWLNTSKDGETTYLSVSREDGEDIAIFPNHPVLRLALEWIHDLQSRWN